MKRDSKIQNIDMFTIKTIKSYELNICLIWRAILSNSGLTYAEISVNKVKVIKVITPTTVAYIFE